MLGILREDCMPEGLRRKKDIYLDAFKYLVILRLLFSLFFFPYFVTGIYGLQQITLTHKWLRHYEPPN